MIDIKSVALNEISRSEELEKKDFDPDKRIDADHLHKPKEYSEYDIDKRISVGDRENAVPKDAPVINEQQNENISKNEIKEKNEPIKNKQEGLERERKVEEELKSQYPERKGYEILSEVYLRDENGSLVRDPLTGETRRIDFVAIKNGKAVDSIEVTSITADKTEQSAKEERIRANGGNYIRDNNGILIEIPSDIHTRIERRE